MKGPDMYDPTNPDEHADLDPVAAVVAAWTSQWPDEKWQVDNIQYLRDIFPALTAALDRLVAAQEAEDAPRPELLEAPVTTEMLDMLRHITGTALPSTSEFTAPFEDDDKPNVEAVEEVTFDEFNPDEKTIDEVKERARLATERIKKWSRERSLRKSVAHETQLRLKLVAWLNNRSEVQQRDLAEAIGVSRGRIAQLIAEYYDQIDRELKLPLPSRKRRPALPK